MQLKTHPFFLKVGTRNFKVTPFWCGVGRGHPLSKKHPLPPFLWTRLAHQMPPWEYSCFYSNMKAVPEEEITSLQVTCELLTFTLNITWYSSLRNVCEWVNMLVRVIIPTVLHYKRYQILWTNHEYNRFFEKQTSNDKISKNWFIFFCVLSTACKYREKTI